MLKKKDHPVETKSPCTNNCNFNYVTKLCTGCFRTIDEIMTWSTLTNKEKELVLRLAENRKKADEKNASS